MQWPHRASVDYLVKRYFDFVAPTYRMLHQGTVERWVDLLFGEQDALAVSGPATANLPSAARAIILTVCATASLFFDSHHESGKNVSPISSDGQQSETYYQMAEQLLAQESGAPSLESVQARLLTVLYLLNTSRMNQAWFKFGSTIQLLMTLGLHRKQARSRSLFSVSSAQVTLECSKRVLWCGFTLDQYLSLIIGRPRLLHEEEIDQEFPELVNDEMLDAQSSRHCPPRDCLMNAAVCHAKVACILARASQELYSIRRIGKAEEVRMIGSMMDQINQWQSELPPLLGPSVCPSSLILIFQRQLTVIRLAGYHAVMFVTRPLLLQDYSEESTDLAHPLKDHLRSCINTARNTLELDLDLVKENLLFPSFWFTQYIAFNALSIVYIYLIQNRRGRIPHAWLFADAASWMPTVNQTSLYRLAEEAQYHLGQATEKNSVAWRYHVVLEALRAEATGQTNGDEGRSAARTSTISHAVPSQPRREAVFDGELTTEPSIMNWENLQDPISFDTEIGNLLSVIGPAEEICLDFWPQLDRLPTCKSFPPDPSFVFICIKIC